MKTNTYRAALALLDEHKIAIINKLCESILELPDNPDIKRVSNNSFTISSSDVFKSKSAVMSGYHYDFKFQYRKISDKLKETGDINCLDKILSEAKIVEHGHSFTLHDTVIENVKKLLEQ
jgi:hypothetical protein